MGDEDSRKTWKNLRAESDVPTLAVAESDRLARSTDATAAQREEAKWRALFASGLINLESIPSPREGIKWSVCDDVEVRVLLRARGGTKIATMVKDATYSADQIIGAICRLASRGLLQIP